MYRVIAALVLICMAFPAALAQPATCTEAKEIVMESLAQAEAALSEDRIAEATDLLRDARLILIRDCGSAAGQAALGNANLSENAQITAPDVNPNGGVAYVRVVNLSVDSPTVDVRGMNNQFVVQNLGFGEFTSLIPIPSGSHTFGGTAWDFSNNSTWVLAVTGLRSTASVAVQPIAVMRNDLKDQARVRVVQTISGIGRIDVASDDGIVFGNGLGWLGNQDTMVDAGDYVIRAETSAGAAVIPPTTFTFDANQSYVLFLNGAAQGSPAPVFVMTISPQDMTRVRFVNAGADAIDVHYRPGNAKIAASLGGGETSEWVEIPTSAVTFVAYRPGTGPTGQEIASIAIPLRSGRDMTITLERGQMTLTESVFTP